MKAWPLLLVGIGSRIGACAEPPRRPPVTYVPIVRAPEPPPPVLPSSLAAGLDAPAAPAGKEPATSTTMVAVSTGTEALPTDDQCFKRAITACCGETSVPSKKVGGKSVCPGRLVLGTRCKGFGPKCH